MKELDWIFDDEEINPNESPLKIGNIIDYVGLLNCYVNGRFTKTADIISLPNKEITKIKKFKNGWIFRLKDYSFWFIYNEKYINIIK